MNRIAPTLSEQRLGHGLERSLEIGEREALVDRQTLDLIEDRQVRGVGRLAPVDAPRTDDVDGRWLRLHRSDLRRRGLGPQQELGMPGDRDVEGVPRRAGGVIRGDVEGLEVVPVVLDLGTFHHAVPESEEDVHDLVLGERHRVERAGARTPPRQGQIDPVCRQQLGVGALGERLAPGGDDLADRLVHLVRTLPDGAAVLLGESAERATDLAERRLAPENGHVDRTDGLRRVRGREQSACALELDVEGREHRRGIHG